METLPWIIWISNPIYLGWKLFARMDVPCHLCNIQSFQQRQRVQQKVPPSASKRDTIYRIHSIQSGVQSDPWVSIFFFIWAKKIMICYCFRSTIRFVHQHIYFRPNKLTDASCPELSNESDAIIADDISLFTKQEFSRCSHSLIN